MNIRNYKKFRDFTASATYCSVVRQFDPKVCMLPGIDKWLYIRTCG